MEQLTMSRKERERLVILNKVKAKELSRREAADVLGLSLRQVHRLWLRFQADGDAGLAHRSRGRASPRRLAADDRAAALAAYRSRYRGFGPTLFAEKLAEHEGIWISHDTATRLLRAEGLLERTRRGRRSRRRRERKARFGEMVQMDGSPHAWFGPDHPRCVLMTVIDDATGRRRGRFAESETTASAMDAFGRWCERFGVPASLYVDRHSIYRATREATAEELRARARPATQFGRAMAELNVGLILARSPQAKGRVERSNGVLQDRLVKELALAGVGGIDAANAWLGSSGFFEKLDAKFAVEAADQADAHRPLVSVLADVLCVKERRTVGLDGCVQWSGRLLQLSSDAGAVRLVEVWERFDGTLSVWGDGRKLAWTELNDAARLDKAKAKRLAGKKRPIVNNKPFKPNAKQRISLGRPVAAAVTKAAQPRETGRAGACEQPGER
jgi:transposase